MCYNNFPNPKAKPILPSNYHRGKHVHYYVEEYAKSQKLRLDQVLDVQGVDLILWNKTLSKRFCTCQGLNSSIFNNPAVVNDVYTKDTEAKQKIEKQMEVPQITKITKALSIANDSGLDSLASLIEEQLLKDIEQEPIEEKQVKVTTAQNGLIEQALIRQKKNLGVEYNEYSNCPICFNTRHVDTYQPYNGQRLVFDASDYYPIKTEGVIIKKDTHPWVFNFVNNTGYVEWLIELPTYFTVDSIKIFNLEHIQTDCQLEYQDPISLIYVPLTITSLQARNGLKNNLKVRASLNTTGMSKNLANQLVNISHIEFVLRYSDTYEKMDMPAVDLPENFEQIEIFLRSRFILSSRINLIMRGSIINDRKLGLMWEIMDIVKNYTADRQLVNVEVDCRVIQNSEKLFNLSIFPVQFSMWRTSFNSFDSIISN